MKKKGLFFDSKIQADPFGSYTGRALDGDVPVQDADDL